MMSRVRRFVAIAALAIFSIASGCQTVPEGKNVAIPAQETPQDQALSKSVRDKLLTNDKVDMTDIKIVSSSGTVYLTGSVHSLDARQQAVKTAWEVRGVQSVINSLEVRK